jgi:hypothetical protein
MAVTRRGLLNFLVASPLVVPATHLMRLRGLILPEPISDTHFQIMWREKFIRGCEGTVFVIRKNERPRLISDDFAIVDVEPAEAGRLVALGLAVPQTGDFS